MPTHSDLETRLTDCTRDIDQRLCELIAALTEHAVEACHLGDCDANTLAYQQGTAQMLVDARVLRGRLHALRESPVHRRCEDAAADVVREALESTKRFVKDAASPEGHAPVPPEAQKYLDRAQSFAAAADTDETVPPLPPE